MDYLVTMVMDDYQERPADWYDFVWNRTRGIRKVWEYSTVMAAISILSISQDITLQHLCTVESTELTEKCARWDYKADLLLLRVLLIRYFRFHILCSHLLCEEDTNTFDPRMNSENLNKCLLSLKEFYRDLRVEKVSTFRQSGMCPHWSVVVGTNHL